MAKTKPTLKALIKGLNEDLAAEYSAIIMYTTYAAEVDGVDRTELKQFFQADVAEEQTHAQMLAEKIVSLGGTPVRTAAPVKEAKSNKERLEAALDAEKDTIKRYGKRIGQAEQLGEIALKIEIENLIVDETKHRDELRLMLKNY
jgi:bacterioferritin